MQQYSIRFTFDGQDYFANFDSEFSALQIELVESGDFVAGNAALAGTALTALFHMRAVEHWGEDGNAEFFDKAFRADQTFRAAVTTAETNSWWSDAGEVAGGSLASAAGSVQAGAPVAAAISVIPGLGLPAAGVSLGLTATTSALAGGVTAALTVSARNADIAYNGMLGTFGGSLNADLINYFMEFVADIDVDPETGARRIGELRPITDTEITWSDFNTQSASAIANLYTVAAMAGEIERVEGNLPQTDLWQSYVDSFAASLITSKDPTGISGAVLGSARSVFDLHARDGRPESFEAFIASIESHIDSRVSEVTSELRGLLNNAGRRGFTYIGTDNDDRFVVGADSATIYTLGGRNEVLAPEGGSHTIIGGSGDLTVSLAVDALGGKNVVHGGDGHNALTLDISALDVGEMATAAWRPAIKPNTNWSASSLRVERLTPEDVTFAQARAFAEASTAEMHRERYLFLDTTLEGQSRLMRSGDVWSGQFDPVPDSAFHLRELDMLHYEGGAGDDLLIPFGNGVTRAIGGGGTNTLYVDWRDFAADVVWDLNATLEDETELANGWTVQGIHRLLGYMGDGDHDITFVGGGNHIVAGDGDYRLIFADSDNHVVGGDGDYHVRGAHGGDHLDLRASGVSDVALRDLGNGNLVRGGSGDLTVSLAVDALGGKNVVHGGDGHNALTLDISALDVGEMATAAWRPAIKPNTNWSASSLRVERLTPEDVTFAQARAFAEASTAEMHRERYLFLDTTLEGQSRLMRSGDVWSGQFDPVPDSAFHLRELDMLHYEGGAGDDLLIPFGNGVTRAIGGGGTNTLYVDWRDFAADVVWDLNATLEDETELANGWTVQGIHRLLGYMGDGDHDITFVGGGNHIVAGDGDYLIRSTHGGDRLELAASRNADIALRDLGNGNEITGGSGDLTVSLAVDALGGVNVVRGGDGHNALTLDISALDTGQMPDAAWRPLLISGTGRTPQRSRLDPETVTLSQAETFARGTVTTSRHMVEGERWLYLDDGTGAEGATGTQIRTFNLDTLNYIGGDGNDLMIGLGGDEFFRGGLGNDVVVLNGGSNRIIGTLEELHGDRILDLTTRDVIVVEGIELADHNVAFDTAETRLIITPEGSEIAFHIDLYGEFIPQAFEVTVVGEISEIRYLGEIAPDPILLPNLDLSAIQDGPVIEGRVFDIDTGFSVLSVNGMPVTEDSLYDGILGTLQISDDGVFSYNPDMAVHLPEDERQDDLFTLVVSNSVGDTSELVIRASVTGVNDPASISGDSTGLVIEDDADRQQASGVLTVIDPDAGEDRFADVDPAALAGDYGSFAFDPESGAWSYTLDNDLDAVQALPEGAEVTDSLSVSSLDGTATETITVTITGSGLRGDFAPATVSGSVHDRWGNPISDAAVQFVPEAANLESSASAGDQEGPGVTLSGDVRMGIVHTGEATNQNGHFTFELDRGSSGDIELIRGYDNDRDGGPGLRDALDVLRLSMGLSVSGRETEALDFIAADVNQDGVIDAQDSTAVLRAALGLETDHGSRWIFIDDAADLSGLDRNNSSVATGFRVDEINSDIADLAMTGILLGTMQENA